MCGNGWEKGRRWRWRSGGSGKSLEGGRGVEEDRVRWRKRLRSGKNWGSKGEGGE